MPLKPQGTTSVSETGDKTMCKKCSFCNNRIENKDEEFFITDDETLQDFSICYECYLDVYGEDLNIDYELIYDIETHEINTYRIEKEVINGN